MRKQSPRFELKADSQQVEIRGRLAAIYALLLRDREEVERIDVGKIVLSVAHDQVKIEYRYSRPGTSAAGG